MGRTVRVEESVQIARPPADVWSAIADYGFDREWRSRLSDTKPDPPGPPALGTKVHEVVRSRFKGNGTIGGLEGGRAVRPDAYSARSSARSCDPADEGSPQAQDPARGRALAPASSASCGHASPLNGLRTGVS
jgi:hypothetical protein